MGSVTDIVAKGIQDAMRNTHDHEVVELANALVNHAGSPDHVGTLVAEFVTKRMPKAPDLEQYLISTQDENGDDKSLVVTAASPEEAVAEWGRYFEDDQPNEDMKVFVVPPKATEARAHSWHGDMVEVEVATPPKP